MEEWQLEEIWNGRFSDDINDDWQRLALSSVNWQSFLDSVKEVLKQDG